MTLFTLSITNVCCRRGAFSVINRHRPSSMKKNYKMCTNSIHQCQTPTFHINNRHTRYFSTPTVSSSLHIKSTPPTILYLSSSNTNDNSKKKKYKLITKPIEQCNISSEKKYVLYYHGKSLNKDGISGSGMVLYEDIDSDNSSTEEIWWANQRLEDVTLNEAEYITLATSLEYIKSLGIQHIKAYGHNKLILKQIEGINKVKSPLLKTYYDKVIELSKEFISFEIGYVDKSMNGRAIELAIDAIGNNNNTMVEDIDNDTITKAENDASPKTGEDIKQQNLDNFSPSTTSHNQGPSEATHVPQSDSISPDKTYVLRFDGGSRGNPGCAGCGMVLYDTNDGAEIWSGYQYLGESNTNNEAEYMGLITGLQCARSLGIQNIVVQGDSQLILRQLEGRYKVKSPNLKVYYEEALSVSREFTSFETSHIERARNSRADELANLAMDSRSTSGFDVE